MSVLKMVSSRCLPAGDVATNAELRNKTLADDITKLRLENADALAKVQEHLAASKIESEARRLDDVLARVQMQSLSREHSSVSHVYKSRDYFVV